MSDASYQREVEHKNMAAWVNTQLLEKHSAEKKPQRLEASTNSLEKYREIFQVEKKFETLG